MTVNEFTHNEDFEDFNGNESIIFSYNHDWEILDIDYRCKSMDHLHLSLSLDRIDCKNLYEYLNNINEFNNSKSKTITKPLIDFTKNELDNICSKHPGCIDCPMDGLTVDGSCVERLIKHTITVKESDLKDG